MKPIKTKPASAPKEEYYAPTRKAWRKWLEKNHLTKSSVWLVIHKKNAPKKSVQYADAVEEALCFGWIDSKPNKKDVHSFILYFAKRKPKSNWSSSNKIRVAHLMDQGLILPAGMESIATAKANGSWDSLNDVDQLLIPSDLEAALRQNNPAEKNFKAFPKSVTRAILHWIKNAKREETRKQRVLTTATLAAANIRANQYVKK